jgi:UDP-glucose 4-epimerase
MRYLITGGAGFIGSHLADRLLADGHEVWAIDDLSTGSIYNIEHLKTHPRYHYVIDSVMNVPLLAELVDRVDTVVHLAAAVGVKLIVESPVRTIETNVRGTEVVLHAAAKKKRRVFVASTSEVYGKTEKVPFSEDADLVMGPTTKGRWSYACSKMLDEFLTLAYWKEKKLPTTVIRFFNTVGPRQTAQYGMVVPTFVQQALANRPITVYGDGKQTRSFTYVGDVVESLVRLMSTDASIGEVFNIGNDREISIEDLALMIRERVGSSSELTYIPYDQAYEAGFEDMPRRVPDVAKLERLTGYRPTTTLEDIIDAVAEHFRTKSLSAAGD